MRLAGCPLCEAEGGVPVWRDEALRVIRAQEAGFPAFYRVIWNDHVAEWTDLPPADRSRIMQAVAKVETVLRAVLRPTKINLAAFGNVVPHLHWHVMARFDWDSHYPNPFWGAAVRVADAGALARIETLLPALDAAVAQALGEGAPSSLITDSGR